jgi:hypothetical protein
MKASNHNLNTLMLFLHKMIEEYSDYTASTIEQGNPLDHVTYPPNNGFTAEEENALKILQNNPELKSAIRKLIANSIAGVFFEFFHIIDGTSDPAPELGKWTELALVDKEESNVPTTDMLHDKLFESYWEWRKIRTNQEWKLDNYED